MAIPIFQDSLFPYLHQLKDNAFTQNVGETESKATSNFTFIGEDAGFQLSLTTVSLLARLIKFKRIDTDNKKNNNGKYSSSRAGSIFCI